LHNPSTGFRETPGAGGDLQDFPVAMPTLLEQRGGTLSRQIKRGSAMLSNRAGTGFGGLFAVLAILFSVQLIAGAASMPL